MQINIESTAIKAAAELGVKGADVPRAAKKALTAATRVLFDESRKQLNVIYAREIPRWGTVNRKTGKVRKRGTGKPMWKRKGTLRRGEAMMFPSALTGMIANANDTPYAEARHDLNKPGAGGVTRHDPWRTKTVAAKGEEAGKTFERVFNEEMGK